MSPRRCATGRMVCLPPRSQAPGSQFLWYPRGHSSEVVVEVHVHSTPHTPREDNIAIPMERRHESFFRAVEESGFAWLRALRVCGGRRSGGSSARRGHVRGLCSAGLVSREEAERAASSVWQRVVRVITALHLVAATGLPPSPQTSKRVHTSRPPRPTTTWPT